MERIIVRTAAGFDVVAGRRLNDKPLDRAAADRLAKGSPATAARASATMAAKAKHVSHLKEPDDPAPPPSPPVAEVHGPHLPPNTRIQFGRLVGIPPTPKSGAETKAMADRANAKPVPASLFEGHGWDRAGGSSGFSWNGNLVSGRKPR
jgi:hypothetical protein